MTFLRFLLFATCMLYCTAVYIQENPLATGQQKDAVSDQERKTADILSGNLFVGIEGFQMKPQNKVINKTEHLEQKSPNDSTKNSEKAKPNGGGGNGNKCKPKKCKCKCSTTTRVPTTITTPDYYDYYNGY